jgi:DNA processing protein
MSVDLPEQAYATALAATAKIGPATLRQALGQDRPADAWRKLCATQGATERDVLLVWQMHAERGIAVVLADDDAYPERLRRDPQAPAVLFCVGDPLALHAPATVALVGTRAPTRYGIGVAAQFGADLAAAGVSVVSGLALGIDGAAHEGACGAGAAPVGVVAGGLDKPYPARHTRLWQRVAEHGAVVSESPAGVRTERWRFPVRNRLLAALSDVVVVIESRHHGGARHTVDAAAALGLPVGAVPGSIRSATSEGTNALLADGAFPACSTADILVALSLAGVRVSPPAGIETFRAGSNRRSPDPGEDRVLYEALSSDPASLDDLVRVTGLGLPTLCGGLERLAQAGLAHDIGGWWQRA